MEETEFCVYTAISHYITKNQILHQSLHPSIILSKKEKSSICYINCKAGQQRELRICDYLCLFPLKRGRHHEWCKDCECTVSPKEDKLSSPPVWNFQPSMSMYSKLDSRNFVLYLSPEHIDRIFLLWGILKFIVMRDAFKPPPHFNPSLFRKLPELINHVTRLHCFFYGKENWELTVVNFILKGKLNLITHNDRNTVAHNSIKQTAWWWCVSCRMQTELWWPHPLCRLVWQKYQKKN